MPQRKHFSHSKRDAFDFLPFLAQHFSEKKICECLKIPPMWYINLSKVLMAVTKLRKGLSSPSKDRRYLRLRYVESNCITIVFFVIFCHNRDLRKF